MAKGTGSDQTDFQKMLQWLDSDADNAIEIYQAIRLKLTKIFYARGCPNADELTDETIDRVVKKINGLVETYEGNPSLYFYGVAKYVFLEWTRQPKVKNALPNNLKQIENVADEAEKRDVCLTRCLKKLSSEESDFILSYYLYEKGKKIENRQKLSETIGVPANSLRVNAYRIRLKLQDCVLKCLK